MREKIERGERAYYFHKMGTLGFDGGAWRRETRISKSLSITSPTEPNVG